MGVDEVTYLVATPVEPLLSKQSDSSSPQPIIPAIGTDGLLFPIEKHLALKQLESGTLVLYDVTSTYLEGNGCELGKYG